MLDRGNQYKGPMSNFLNVFTQEFRHEGDPWQSNMAERFKQTIDVFAATLGKAAFQLKKGRALNAAMFDSMTVGVARRLSVVSEINLAKIPQIHAELLIDTDYVESVSQSTSNEVSVCRHSANMGQKVNGDSALN